jgi:hypothetical protein
VNSTVDDVLKPASGLRFEAIECSQNNIVASMTTKARVRGGIGGMAGHPDEGIDLKTFYQ